MVGRVVSELPSALNRASEASCLEELNVDPLN
jgi:hypothetical protein